ncbi:hypothetical protein PVAP13_4NG100719 [Panicum virgatum]|uniref:Uncharacterized protein n=1 Tax=Panicum virgatum TaxID=38727 RepID=A0A8T0T7L1_PANVG|nr:hypothetical protein PVAP13_4NG100719 [Panicum virgatum]
MASGVSFSSSPMTGCAGSSSSSPWPTTRDPLPPPWPAAEGDPPATLASPAATRSTRALPRRAVRVGRPHACGGTDARTGQLLGRRQHRGGLGHGRGRGGWQRRGRLGGTLGEELRVGQDLERGAAAAVREEDPLHGLGSPDGDGGLLDDNLVLAGARRGGDHARRALPVGEVGGPAGAEAPGLGGRVDGHEDDVGVGDVAVDVGAEGEVAAAAGPDDATGRRSLFLASMRGRETSTMATSMDPRRALPSGRPATAARKMELPGGRTPGRSSRGRWEGAGTWGALGQRWEAHISRGLG